MGGKCPRRFGRTALHQCFPKCNPCNSSITWELARNETLGASPATYWIRNSGVGVEPAVLTSLPGDSNAGEGLRTAIRGMGHICWDRASGEGVSGSLPLLWAPDPRGQVGLSRKLRRVLPATSGTQREFPGFLTKPGTATLVSLCKYAKGSILEGTPLPLRF